jgi:hypothetical protein
MYALASAVAQLSDWELKHGVIWPSLVWNSSETVPLLFFADVRQNTFTERQNGILRTAQQRKMAVVIKLSGEMLQVEGPTFPSDARWK